jgi:hypothetical protein
MRGFELQQCNYQHDIGLEHLDRKQASAALEDPHRRDISLHLVLDGIAY